MTMLSVNWPFIWLVTGVGFIMVFILLIVLMYIMKGLGALSNRISRKVESKAAVATTDEAIGEVQSQTSDNDEIPVAAIAMALHLYYNSIHDEEPTKITIRRIESHGSPWNSKLFGMNNLHR